ncbi:MAG: hypothetical protein ACI835_004571 [Planctomycetota bacterium]|jgi:hypothetical protein
MQLTKQVISSRAREWSPHSVYSVSAMCPTSGPFHFASQRGAESDHEVLGISRFRSGGCPMRLCRFARCAKPQGRHIRQRYRAIA